MQVTSHVTDLKLSLVLPSFLHQGVYSSAYYKPIGASFSTVSFVDFLCPCGFFLAYLAIFYEIIVTKIATFATTFFVKN